MPQPVITVEGLSKKYAVFASPADRLKEMILRRRYHHEFWALRDVSFAVGRGESFGIIGPNGSGKSTLLQILAGTMRPTSGWMEVNGRVAALLELGAGFNPEFTGRENVFLNGAIMGLSEREIRRRYDDIVAFADIGEFIDQPVKTYSSGMYIRLAFASVINVDPDVLIVDEALAVGDAYFQQRCMLRMADLQAAGVTILFVSHDTNAVKSLCTSALLLEEGRVCEIGSPDQVVKTYFDHIQRRRRQRGDVRPQPAVAQPGDLVPATVPPIAIERDLPNTADRFGDGRAELLGVGIYDQDGERVAELPQGTPLRVRVSARYHESIAQPNCGVVIKNRHGLDLIGANCLEDGYVMPPAAAGEIRTIEFAFSLPDLYPGDYTLTVAMGEGNNPDHVICDWIHNVVAFTIVGSYGVGTLIAVPTAIQVWLAQREDPSSVVQLPRFRPN